MCISDIQTTWKSYKEEQQIYYASILIKKLEPKEIDQLVEILKDDSNNITW